MGLESVISNPFWLHWIRGTNFVLFSVSRQMQAIELKLFLSVLANIESSGFLLLLVIVQLEIFLNDWHLDIFNGDVFSFHLFMLHSK